MAEFVTGKIVAGKYRLDAVIREGALGDMYRAWHLMMEKPLTLCVLPNDGSISAELRNAFFDSVKMQARLAHPNILIPVDSGTDADGDLYVAYDSQNCETLAAFIDKYGRIDAGNAAEIARQIASALAAIHDAGIIHGNLTAHSILLSEVAESAVIAKVADIGLPGPLELIDVDMVSAGDFAYLPPEQCTGAAEPGVCGDIYSLGVVFYEMLAGEAPFSAESASEMMRRQAEELPPPLVAFRSDLPAGLEPIVLRALSKKPEMRYASASEFIAALDNIFPAAIAPLPEREQRGRGEIWKTIAYAVAGISILAAALIYSTSVKQTVPPTQVQPDAGGIPVQPINPATGIEEQKLASMPGGLPEVISNSNSAQPGMLPGGDGYDPWASGPPIPPGGRTITIDPNSGSQFMPPDGCVLQPSGILLCPKPPTSNTNTSASPSPTPKPTPGANVQPSPAAPANVQPRATPTPNARPTPRPTPANDDPGDLNDG
ncbi:MAG TPA: hypothetical protein DEA22_08005 [Blastocatellia bacterium]|nr:hypothetical protein [Blastocatellia bacterium]